MRRAAFLTYNSIGEEGDFQNGMIETKGHQALIVQHPKGQKWGAGNGLEVPTTLGLSGQEDEDRTRQKGWQEERRKLIPELYGKVLNDKIARALDYIVVYVGTGGSEGTVELAKFAGEKARFIVCRCGLARKIQQIMTVVSQDAQVMISRCGGQEAMKELLEAFLETGEIPTEGFRTALEVFDQDLELWEVIGS